MGTFGWDDEGVAAQQVPLIQNGIFVGYLSSRETAPRIGRQSGGAMRADGWNRIPLIRMTNINLEPGTTPLAGIIADTKHGIFVDTNRAVRLFGTRQSNKDQFNLIWGARVLHKKL